MNKVAHYLQEHLTGEVLTSTDACKYFSTDASILTIPPAMIVYPRSENDVRKTTRFTWQLAERGKIIPVTARGSGTDLTGAALGEGVIMAFPAHLNRILELDGKTGLVTVEPGINYGKLQQTLHTHNRFMPPYPASLEFSTVGGAVANNAAGEKSVKYGNTRDYVKGLRVVLANGEVIETHRLSKRELNKKLGLASFEGEVYRALDTLIEENQDTIKSSPPSVAKNSAGYALSEVKRKDGSFDLTPLFVGAQGTLGVITEITLETVVYNPNTVLLAAQIDDLATMQDVVVELKKFSELPSAIEIVDQKLLEFVHHYNPNHLRGIVEAPFSKVLMLIEFDNPNARARKRLCKKAVKLLQKHNVTHRVETDAEKKDELWKVRHSAAQIIAYSENNNKALPIIEDGVVPDDRLAEYMNQVYALFEKYDLRPAVWGHVGSGNLHMQPFLDLSQVGDRQKAFKLMDDYYKLVIGMGGSISGQHGDGRLRGVYTRLMFGAGMYDLFEKVKSIFDPYGTLNPGVKVGVLPEQLRSVMRNDYSAEHLYDHLPRS